MESSISALAVAGLVLCVTTSVACSRRASVAHPQAVPGYTADHASIRLLGRGEQKDGTLSVAWPASGMEFVFEGRHARIHLDERPFPDSTPAYDYLSIQVDNSPAFVRALQPGRQTIELGQTLSRGRHHVRIRKRTEAEVGTVVFMRVELDEGGRMLDLPARRPVLEAVGDSITAGFGCEGGDATCPFSSADENALATYTALAAAELGYDYSAVAWSGKGIVRNDDARDVETLPRIYDRALPSMPQSMWQHDSAMTPLVVLNLGTNDCAHGCPSEDALVEGYTALLGRIRTTHENAKIVLVLGPMLYDEGAVQHRSEVRRALERTIHEMHERQDRHIALMELWANPDEGQGCQFHPNRRAHVRFAHELTEFVRALQR